MIVQVREPFDQWDVALQQQFNHVRNCVNASFLSPSSYQAESEGVVDKTKAFTNVGYSADIFPKYHTEQKRDLFTIHVYLLQTVKHDDPNYVKSFEAFHEMLVQFHKSKGFTLPDNRQYNMYAKHERERSLYVWQSRHWLGLYDADQHKRVIFVQGLYHKKGDK